MDRSPNSPRDVTLMNHLSPAAMAAPLAVRMRPRSLEEVVGQQHLLRPGSPLLMLTTDGCPTAISVILWGPPGTGKTTLAQVIARPGGPSFTALSAVSSSVKEVRSVVDQAKVKAGQDGNAPTVLFLDEIHRFTKAQQDALLPGVENGWVTLVAATTENPSFSVVSALLSRSMLLTLEPLTDDDLGRLLRRAVTDSRGLNGMVDLTDGAVEMIVRLSSGDARRALTALEAAAGAVRRGADAAAPGVRGEARPHKPTVTAEIVSACLDRALLRYDRDGDQHHDVVSAFTKSIRGSDPDAAIHYLARMIEAGEDPAFIARRLVIQAGEDVGMADSRALQIAVAAAEAVRIVGLPEARIPLAEATIYIATAPKSNSVSIAIDSALSDIRRGYFSDVPKHLRHSQNRGSRLLGHGRGYKSPHNDPRGIVPQRYMPEVLTGRMYYEPADRGEERAMIERLAKIKSITTRQGRGSKPDAVK